MIVHIHLSALLGALFAASTLAHMQLHYPAPFNASNNPHRNTSPDPYLQFPYDCCGPNDRWEYPCRGYLSLLGTDQGAPTATWEVGTPQSFNLSGIGNHYGGSCQVGFSTDKGDSFRVVTSYEGNCPYRHGGTEPENQNFNFIVPDDLPIGVQVFAWTWYNHEQEFNMDCAAVNITARGGGSPDYPPQPAASTTCSKTSTSASTTEFPKVIPASILPVIKTYSNCSCTCEIEQKSEKCACDCPETEEPQPQTYGARPAKAVRRVNAYRRLHHRSNSIMSASSSAPDSIAFHKRPLMLIADDGNGCLTPNSTAELKFPDPGPEVVQGDGEYPLELPSGNCSQQPGQQAYHGGQ